jgi:hypothetical protein
MNAKDHILEIISTNTNPSMFKEYTGDIKWMKFKNNKLPGGVIEFSITIQLKNGEKNATSKKKIID